MENVCAEKHIDTQNTKLPNIRTYRNTYIQAKIHPHRNINLNIFSNCIFRMIWKVGTISCILLEDFCMTEQFFRKIALLNPYKSQVLNKCYVTKLFFDKELVLLAGVKSLDFDSTFLKTVVQIQSGVVCRA